MLPRAISERANPAGLSWGFTLVLREILFFRYFGTLETSVPTPLGIGNFFLLFKRKMDREKLHLSLHVC